MWLGGGCVRCAQVQLVLALCWLAAAEKKGRLVEELTAETFQEKVAKVAESSGKPPYQPVVMFHQPWCEHCRKTIPELKETAEKVAEAAEQGQLKQYPAVPKIFMLSCAEPGAEPICNNYTGKSYPSIIVFKNGRRIKFNRPRVASVITWWTFRVTRRPVSLLESKSVLRSLSENEVAFLLHVASSSPDNMQLVHLWEERALDHIEDYSFFFTVSSTELGKSLGAAPGLSVHGPASLGLKPLPLRGELGEETMQAWVEQNQFPPVVEASPWTMPQLSGSGLKVVALLHESGPEGDQELKVFKEKALKLRQDSNYVFATLNASDEENSFFLKNRLSLVATMAGPSRIFVMAGAEGGTFNFWEDPKFPSADAMDLEALDKLLKDPEAFHDESYASMFKGKRKLIVRFVTTASWPSLGMALAMVLVGCGSCGVCCRAMWQALFEADEEPPEPKKTD